LIEKAATYNKRLAPLPKLWCLDVLFFLDCFILVEKLAFVSGNCSRRQNVSGNFMSVNSICKILIILGTIVSCSNWNADQKEIMTKQHQDSINKFLEWLIKVDTTIKYGSRENGYMQNFKTGQFEKMTKV
jgi:hypothetical protein